MGLLNDLIDVFLHLDSHLAQWAAILGNSLHLVLFLIIFCETGLVITPLLPGDSLLFAVGALASVQNSPLNLALIAVLLSIAAIAGDSVNYAVGYRVGPRVFKRENSRLLNQNYLLRAQRFYEKHGGKTIIIARFVPIIRTFAPFVAGIGRMNYARFAFFNISGGILWVLCFLLGGYYFGNIPVVKRNFHFVIFAIIVISCLPAVIEYLRARRQAGERTPDDISNSARRPLTTESGADEDRP